MRGQSCSSERRLCSRCPLSVQTVTLVPYESRTLQAPLCLGFAACVRFVVIADSSTSETGCGSPEGPCTRQAAGEPSVRRVASYDELRCRCLGWCGEAPFSRDPIYAVVRTVSTTRRHLHFPPRVSPQRSAAQRLPEDLGLALPGAATGTLPGRIVQGL